MNVLHFFFSLINIITISIQVLVYYYLYSFISTSGSYRFFQISEMLCFRIILGWVFKAVFYYTLSEPQCEGHNYQKTCARISMTFCKKCSSIIIIIPSHRVTGSWLTIDVLRYFYFISRRWMNLLDASSSLDGSCPPSHLWWLPQTCNLNSCNSLIAHISSSGRYRT